MFFIRYRESYLKTDDLLTLLAVLSAKPVGVLISTDLSVSQAKGLTYWMKHDHLYIYISRHRFNGFDKTIQMSGDIFCVAIKSGFFKS